MHRDAPENLARLLTGYLRRVVAEGNGTPRAES
jgi:hypothetical protein